MRLGKIDPEPIYLQAGGRFVLTTADVVGTCGRAATTFQDLPNVVHPSDRLCLNDGLVQLRVDSVTGTDVACTVLVGGELRSRKGINIPGIDLGISAFTAYDRECLQFALANDVDAVSQSFVAGPDDVHQVRAAALAFGKCPFIIAKIERSAAVTAYEEILDAADGIMIARGDLGVETPIEEIAVLQKQLIARANIAGKPVITATQMLESMVSSTLPTRAESTDVANAILDGTDCIMLSAESAMGRHPVEAVAMLAQIAAATEPCRQYSWSTRIPAETQRPSSVAQGMASVVKHALDVSPCAAVIVPTQTGDTARMISRYKPAVWIVAASQTLEVARALRFSYGVEPIHTPEEPRSWRAFASSWFRDQHLTNNIALLVTGASPRHPAANHRIELLRIDKSDANR
jgi:pyruvate kinase